MLVATRGEKKWREKELIKKAESNENHSHFRNRLQYPVQFTVQRTNSMHFSIPFV